MEWQHASNVVEATGHARNADRKCGQRHDADADCNSSPRYEDDAAEDHRNAEVRLDERYQREDAGDACFASFEKVCRTGDAEQDEWNDLSEWKLVAAIPEQDGADENRPRHADDGLKERRCGDDRSE